MAWEKQDCTKTDCSMIEMPDGSKVSTKLYTALLNANLPNHYTEMLTGLAIGIAIIAAFIGGWWMTSRR